jgi:hypothetical protein
MLRKEGRSFKTNFKNYFKRIWQNPFSEDLKKRLKSRFKNHVIFLNQSYFGLHIFVDDYSHDTNGRFFADPKLVLINRRQETSLDEHKQFIFDNSIILLGPGQMTEELNLRYSQIAPNVCIPLVPCVTAHTRAIEFSSNDQAHVAYIDFDDPHTNEKVRMFIGLIESNGRKTVQTSIL